MAETETFARHFHLQEGWLCLDFANTAEWRASDEPEERLNSYVDLVAWAEDKGILTEREAQPLLGRAESHPADADAVLRRAIDLRETIYRIFDAIADDGAPAPADLARLNAALSEAMTHLQITQTDAGFVWDWDDTEGALDQILWPVVYSAADLLLSEELDRVGQCADDRGCGWLFFDTSRNRSRRWCSMETCGNRAKARRFYKQQQTDGQDSA